MNKPKTSQASAEQITTQLYGKQYSLSGLPASSFKRPVQVGKNIIFPRDESKFLRKDLLKILVLSTLAFAFQFSLYFALQRQLINLNFIKLI